MPGMAILLPLPLAGALAAQTASVAAPKAEPVFVEQAAPAMAEGDPSPVYWPEQSPGARANGAEADQVAPSSPPRPVAQLTGETGARAVSQLSAAGTTDPLAQLTESERQVLLEAVEGSDICERQDQIAAIRQLCAARLETRSADFGARPGRALSPEERLLGEGLGGDRVKTLERAIERLGRASASARDFENQAIAAMALRQDEQAEEPAPASEGAGKLSPETQALIEAIVNQVPGTGGPP